MQIFISHSKEDIEFCLRLRDELRGTGYQTWVDVDDIPKGAHWPDAIDDGLEKSDVILGVITPDSVNSRNVKNEWDWALANHKPLLLIKWREARLPHRYVSINYIDFETDFERGLTQLKAALVDPKRNTQTGEHVAVPHVVRGRTAEDRNRAKMLEKVRAFWIEGVLENSLYGAALIELGLEKRLDVVEHPWDMVLRQSSQPARTLPPGTRIINVFDDLGGELLILGEPGAGKTTTLLQLARELLYRAEADEKVPLPVVFNLSSWAQKRPPLASWLVDELSARYQVPRTVGEAWVRDERILPLLDGLDEVQAEYRNDCLEAINEFRRKHGMVDVAVCSRTADYEALASRLKLMGAVILQPLTPQQTDSYLAALGGELDTARDALRRDETLQELVRTPLMLSIMTLAYRGISAEELQAAKGLEDHRKRLFDAYVERMLKRRGDDQQFDRADIFRWLTWLARTMNKRGQTVFFIEGLQPDMLPPDRQRLYMIGVRLLIGLGSGLAVGVPIGLVYGLALALRFGGLGWIIGLGLFFGLIGGLGTGIAFGAPVGLVFGLAGGLRRKLTENLGSGLNEIKVVETLTWSWKEAISELFGGLLVGAVGGLLLAILVSFTFDITVGIGVGLAIGLSVAMAGALLNGLTYGEVELRTRTNQGIRRSLQNALRIGSAFMFAVALAVTIAVAITAGFTIGIPVGQRFGFMVGLSTGLLNALLLGFQLGILGGLMGGLAVAGAGFLAFGGLACIQHFVLRLILSRSRFAPWNYARFLDYATERLFLRKVGGGYIFVHRLLLDYFAARET
jgi:hypothetical protein